jgi:hypothetical protein
VKTPNTGHEPNDTNTPPTPPGGPSNNQRARPRAEHRGTLTLVNDQPIECFVLEGGVRVFSFRQVAGLFGYTGDASRARDGLQWPRFVRQKAIWSRLEQRFTLVSNLPFEFVMQPDGNVPERVAVAFRAELLLDLCDAWVSAALAGETRTSQAPMVGASLRILRGTAHVGLIALIDEATGYQEHRAPGALQAELAELLRHMVRLDPMSWEHTFPDSFFTHLYRLYEIPGDPLARERPHYVAHLINFVVYERLLAGLLPLLDEANPSFKGRRLKKHHQFFGIVARDVLIDHIYMVVRLMAGSRTCYEFEDYLSRFAPGEHEQLTLGLAIAVHEHVMGEPLDDNLLDDDDEPPDPSD